VPRSVLVASGAHIAPNLVTNDRLAQIMDTSDDWIRERTGVETRYFVDKGTCSTDLGERAARQALERAGVTPAEVDLVVFATMTPDHFFPGCAPLLQARLGIGHVPCFDLRQQCTGFLYGLQLADAHIRAGLAKTALVVGAETHSGFMPWGEGSWARLAGHAEAPLAEGEYENNTRFRHLTVLFGDAAAAMVVRASDEDGRGVLDHLLAADGADAGKLCVPGIGFRHRPYVDAAQVAESAFVPVMDGRYVFKMANHRMADAARDILARNGLGLDAVKLVLMHQANLRINEHIQKMLGLRDDQVIHNIQRYGNTTAATIPLLWDEAVQAGRLVAGDLVLMVAFGAGMTWGATLVRV
jgi:3-oxoacyl-[acyl-carrier-protein] synthase-3